MTPLKLRIGEASAKAGVNIQTLRYYERRGLIKEPSRGASGYREYPIETIQIVRLIKRAQKLGFSLNEIKNLLEICQNDGNNCDVLHQVVSNKIRDTKEQLKALDAMQQSLETLLSNCKAKVGINDCLILKHLNEETT